jgi:hypothetical protein
VAYGLLGGLQDMFAGRGVGLGWSDEARHQLACVEGVEDVLVHAAGQCWGLARAVTELPGSGGL